MTLITPLHSRFPKLLGKFQNDNTVNSFLTSSATPPERRAVVASVNFTPGTRKTSYSGNSKEGNVFEKVSTSKTKSKLAIYE